MEEPRGEGITVTRTMKQHEMLFKGDVSESKCHACEFKLVLKQFSNKTVDKLHCKDRPGHSLVTIPTGQCEHNVMVPWNL